jgi:RNA polymerase sigma-70 factor (ECF subfamily)
MADEPGNRGGVDAAGTFDPLRPRLIRIAYRMLGSVADAEDVVQDAFLRWLAADREAVRAPAAFLTRVVTRLCLDQLKSARARRETYIGPWLPDPVVEAAKDAIDEDVTLPLLLALERLSPLERAAFLLHDVFGVACEEIAETIGAIRRHAASWPAGPARTYARAARAFRLPGTAAWRLPRRSSRPRAAAKWTSSARCWRTTSWSGPTAAARCARRCGRSPASRT